MIEDSTPVNNSARPIKKGFAKLTPERRKEISSQGGKRAHELGKAHRFTTEEAREAGRKGGERKSQAKEG